MICILPGARRFSVSNSSIHVCQTALHGGYTPPGLIIIRTRYLSPSRHATFTLLSDHITTILIPYPTRNRLTVQYRTRDYSLGRTTIVTADRHNLSLLLRTNATLTLHNTKCRGRTTTSVIFGPQSDNNLTTTVRCTYELITWGSGLRAGAGTYSNGHQMRGMGISRIRRRTHSTTITRMTLTRSTHRNNKIVVIFDLTSHHGMHHRTRRRIRRQRHRRLMTLTPTHRFTNNVGLYYRLKAGIKSGAHYGRRQGRHGCRRHGARMTDFFTVFGRVHHPCALGQGYAASPSTVA